MEIQDKTSTAMMKALQSSGILERASTLHQIVTILSPTQQTLPSLPSMQSIQRKLSKEKGKYPGISWTKQANFDELYLMHIMFQAPKFD